MVFGIFPDCDSAEMALTNFSEIGLGMRDVSAIAKDDADIDALSTHGPLTGLFSAQSFEIQPSFDEADWKKIEEGMEKGSILLAISDEKVPQEIIEEMLRDNKAMIISSLDSLE